MATGPTIASYFIEDNVNRMAGELEQYIDGQIATFYTGEPLRINLSSFVRHTDDYNVRKRVEDAYRKAGWPIVGFEWKLCDNACTLHLDRKNPAF